MNNAFYLEPGGSQPGLQVRSYSENVFGTLMTQAYLFLVFYDSAELLSFPSGACYYSLHRINISKYTIVLLSYRVSYSTVKRATEDPVDVGSGVRDLVGFPRTVPFLDP